MKGLQEIICDNAARSGITVRENLELARQGQFLKSGKTKIPSENADRDFTVTLTRKNEDSAHLEAFQTFVGVDVSTN